MEAVFQFLMEHADLIKLLFDAISSGVPKEKLVEQIKKEMVEASDAAMRAALAP